MEKKPKEKKPYGSVDPDSFFENRFLTYGVVIKAKSDEIKLLQKYLLDKKILIAFDKLSTEKLFINLKNHGDG